MSLSFGGVEGRKYGCWPLADDGLHRVPCVGMRSAFTSLYNDEQHKSLYDLATCKDSDTDSCYHANGPLPRRINTRATEVRSRNISRFFSYGMFITLCQHSRGTLPELCSVFTQKRSSPEAPTAPFCGASLRFLAREAFSRLALRYLSPSTICVYEI